MGRIQDRQRNTPRFRSFRLSALERRSAEVLRSFDGCFQFVEILLHGRQFLIDLHPNLTLLANLLRGLVKLLKSGHSGRSEQITIKPGDEANEIDRHSNPKVLQMRFR